MTWYTMCIKRKTFNFDDLVELAEKQMERSKDNSAKFNKSNPKLLLELAYLQEANALFWLLEKGREFGEHHWLVSMPSSLQQQN